MLTALRKPAAKPATGSGRQLNTWIIDRLRLQPYQHVLEVGVGTGRRLEEAARALRIGFLAGVEPSAPLYQQAYRRNKRYIARQLTQLHLGELSDLPYPPHYFHTVFTTSAILLSKYPQMELLRLTRLLTSGGRLILFVQPKTNKTDTQTPTLIQQHYLSAALPRPEIETYTGPYNSTLAVAIMTD